MNLTTTIVKSISVDYHVLDYSKDDKSKTILMVFLHGSGSRNQDPKNIAELFERKTIQDYNIIIAVPSCVSPNIWEPDTVAALTKDLQKQYNITPEKTCLAGHSMGARGVWMTACMHPELFEYLIPVSGYSYYLMACRLTKMKILCYHAPEDGVVPFSQSQIMCDSIVASGAKKENVKLFPMPKFGHNNTVGIFQSTITYNWLFNARNTFKNI